MKKTNINQQFVDSDADGLTDQEESKLRTDPLKSDTDNDGVNDYVEVKVYGTDPLNQDSDQDGIGDGDEIKMGRNPLGPGSLKDLFIPHEGNNYQPQALHPKRLFIYGFSGVILKIIIVATVAFFPLTAWLTPDILWEQSQKIIELTNVIRQNLNLSVLKENPLLTQAALNKSSDMLVQQYFAHTSPQNRKLADWLQETEYDYQVAGENLAMGFANAEDVVNAWTGSQTHYANMIDSDFNQIGVGMQSGWYNNQETTLVAQFFARPNDISSTKNSVVNKEMANINLMPSISNTLSDNTEVLGDKTWASNPIIFDEKAEEKNDGESLVDFNRTKLFIDQPEGKEMKIIRAEVYLKGEAKSAKISFSDYTFDLRPDNQEINKWVGSLIIFDEENKNIFDTVVLANLKIETMTGGEEVADINWDNITPSKTSLLKQYFLLKSHPSKNVKTLFTLSSIYYQLGLILAGIALICGIFIQIKKQRPRMILTALTFIGLLIVLIFI